MTDLDKAYLTIRNNMVDRIDLFGANMRDAIATGECATEAKTNSKTSCLPRQNDRSACQDRRTCYL